MWDRPDNQEVGLEAATLQRVRNSSLVKWSCAENSTWLSLPPKPWTPLCEEGGGRGAFRRRGRSTERTAGAGGSENAGMSSEKHVRTVFAVSIRFPTAGQSA